MRLTVDKRGFEAYRKRALAEYPMEYLEVLVGTVDEDCVQIKRFVQIPHTVTKTNGGCAACGQAEVPNLDYEQADLDRIKAEAEAEGQQFLGTIHSHPDNEDFPSESDCRDSRRINETVLGILKVWKTTSKRKRSHVQWWPPQKPIEDVSYTKPDSVFSHLTGSECSDGERQAEAADGQARDGQHVRPI